MKVIIVGAGVMGLATALSLRRRGHEVTVLEQGPAPNPKGGSVDQHRLIRFAYGTMFGYARMIRDAYDAWERLWAELGERHYVASGQLLMAEPDDPWLLGARSSFEEFGIEHAALHAAELERRFPMLDARSVPHALWTPTGGVLLAERIVAALATHGRRLGVTLRTHCRVRDIDPSRASVRLADGGTVEGDRLLVAAGPWVGRLVPELAARIAPSRQAVVYLEPPPDLAAAWAVSPMMTNVLAGDGGIFYAVPPVAGTGLKIGDHWFSKEGDPDERRVPTAEAVEAVFALARQRLARLDSYAVVETRTCFYDVVDDERFVAHPLGQGLVLTGFSGHGFKFGAVIGERTAAVLEEPDRLSGFARWLSGDASEPEGERAGGAALHGTHGSC